MKNLTIAMEAVSLHPSTEACLELMLGLSEDHHFSNILDMGCGNAILSIVAARLWENARILGADLSAEALEEARKALAVHGLSERVSLIRSDGFSAREVQNSGPYDLIVANMLAEIHESLGAETKKHLIIGGYCILSGILIWLAEGVEQQYSALGFEILKKIDYSNWRGYLLRHKAAT